MNQLLYAPRTFEPTSPAGVERCNAAGARLETQLCGYEPVSLAQMDAVALMNRIDTKYVLTLAQLEQALGRLSGEYRVLDVAGRRANAYQTLYFDTPDFESYAQHHDGRPKRYKVRSRRYVASNRSFLEVKFKNYQRTRKERMETIGLVTALDPAADVFLDTHSLLHARALEAKLGNDFTRITLVSKTQTERVTLDLDVSFANAERRAALPGVVVAEVKHIATLRHSAFAQQMQTLHLQPTPFSKYCVGVALLYPKVKHNHFKPTLRALDKLVGSYVYA